MHLGDGRSNLPTSPLRANHGKKETFLETTLLLRLTGQIWTTMAAERGRLTGEVPQEVPGWFKDTFLEIAEDVDEASELDPIDWTVIGRR
jgi:hypothetical protein